MSNKADIKKKVISRLNRIVGQVNGVKRMIEAERDCSEIILQIAAVRAAVSQLGFTIMENHMEECVHNAVKHGHTKELSSSLNKVMKQMMK